MTQEYHQNTPTADRRRAVSHGRAQTLPQARRRALVHLRKATRAAHFSAAIAPADVPHSYSRAVLTLRAARQTTWSAVQLMTTARGRDLFRQQSLPERCSRPCRFAADRSSV